MIYCDTSLLVAGLCPEAMTAPVQAWLSDQAAGSLCVSSWVTTEFSSALSLKLRRGELDASGRARVLSNWKALLRDHFEMVPVSHSAFELASRFCDRDELALRAADALHLAVTSLGGHRMATLDKALASAALAVGVVIGGPARRD